MNASKTLTSVAAALALVGTIGYASAQNSTTDAPAMNNSVNNGTTTENVSASPASRVPQTNTETRQQRSNEIAPATNNQMRSSNNDMSSTTNTGTSSSTDSMNDSVTERAPRADRN